MASLIVFDCNGKAQWIALRSGAQNTHNLNRYRNNIEYTDADKAWFRKPLAK